MSRPRKLLLRACAALLALCAGGMWAAVPARAADTGATAAGAAADESPVNPRYVLLDAHGRMVGNEDFPGRFQLITFGYTSCPDVCPTTLSTMARALQALGPLAERLQLVFISVDPERDTPEVLARYTAYFDSRIIGLTGTPDLVRACADHFKVQFRKFREPGSGPKDYAVDHTTGMYLLGPDGGFIRRFADATTAASLGEQLSAVMREEPGR